MTVLEGLGALAPEKWLAEGGGKGPARHPERNRNVQRLAAQKRERRSGEGLLEQICEQKRKTTTYEGLTQTLIRARIQKKGEEKKGNLGGKGGVISFLSRGKRNAEANFFGKGKKEEKHHGHTL